MEIFSLERARQRVALGQRHDVTVVGAGIRHFQQLTLEAEDVLHSARVVFYSAYNREIAEHVRGLNPGVVLREQEAGEYAVGAYRPDMYRRIANQVVAAAKEGPGVVALHPGSAVVVDTITQHIIEGARAAGLTVGIVCGVSCLEVVLAAMEYDVAAGLQVALAQSLVLYGRRLDPTVAAVVIQPGYYDTRYFAGAMRSGPGRFDILQNHLRRSYSENHPMALVLAPQDGTVAPRMFWFRLANLNHLYRLICPYHTLFIPPTGEPTVDAAFGRCIDSWTELLERVELDERGDPLQDDPAHWMVRVPEIVPPSLIEESRLIESRWLSRRRGDHHVQPAPR